MPAGLTGSSFGSLPRSSASTLTRAARLVLAAGLAVAALTGCEAASSTTPGARVPQPNFNAPPLAQAAPAQINRAVVAPPAARTTFATAPYPGIQGPRDWVPGTKPRPWKWIIIHHTATPAGALARIDSSHRSKGWENGAGYDFVIGNGTESRDGQIEVGPRWTKQITGAHTHTPDNRFNELGIGIVLVGNFDETRPSKKQIESAARLVAYLMKTYKVPADRVFGHRDAKATDCPGRYTNLAEIRRLATQALADAGDAIPQPDPVALAPDGGLMHDVEPTPTAATPQTFPDGTVPVSTR